MLVLFAINPGFTQYPAQLKHGEIVYITASGTFNIFIEDQIPTLDRYEFTFTNIETYEKIVSYNPVRNFPHSTNAVEVNSVAEYERFGSVVAMVDLELGNYLVEYVLWDGSGVFVLRNDMGSTMIRFIVQVTISIIALGGFSLAFIFLFHRWMELKKIEDKPIQIAK